MLIVRMQRRLKAQFQLRQAERAAVVDKNIREALVKFKTEKRKIFEQEAAQSIRSVYRTHVFREHLNQAIVSRRFMMRGIYALA